MEGTCQKPVSEFLPDIRRTLSRCEMGKFQQPVELSAELEKRFSDFSQKNVALPETMKEFKDMLHSELEVKRGKFLGSDRPGFDLPLILREDQPQQEDAARKRGEKQFLKPSQQLQQPGGGTAWASLLGLMQSAAKYQTCVASEKMKTFWIEASVWYGRCSMLKNRRGQCRMGKKVGSR
ncbi:tripartite motif-containing protein 15-like isoform X2 [Gopherus flavomarginatus]|uniref:tripartite motif-containing protein 15-like isoform X2 n=1 Tax=Gopherus flavomarginatus TaxID=286002 RepID=UPI0021CC043B|nr:tripartite motif-containing protein 15-like isoform X2 [Gopherus flavomarginatus]